MSKNMTVLGIYSARDGLAEALYALNDAGFRSTDVSVLFPQDDSKDFGHSSCRAPEGAAKGASTGAMIGGALGWLAGMGAFAIPGLGPLVAAGPIIATLTGLGVGSAVGGVAGALIGLGIPEDEAKQYAGKVNEGGILLSVHCDNAEWSRRARGIANWTGAEEVAETSEAAVNQSTRNRLSRSQSANGWRR